LGFAKKLYSSSTLFSSLP